MWVYTLYRQSISSAAIKRHTQKLFNSHINFNSSNTLDKKCNPRQERKTLCVCYWLTVMTTAKKNMFFFYYYYYLRQSIIIKTYRSILCILRKDKMWILRWKKKKSLSRTEISVSPTVVFQENKLSGNPLPRLVITEVGRVISWQQIGKWPFVATPFT